MQYELNLPIGTIRIVSKQGPIPFEVIDGLWKYRQYLNRRSEMKWDVEWRYILYPKYVQGVDYASIQLVTDFELESYIDVSSDERYYGGTWKVGESVFGAAGYDLDSELEFLNLWSDESHLPIYSDLNDGPRGNHKFSIAGKRFVSDDDLSVDFALDFMGGE